MKGRLIATLLVALGGFSVVGVVAAQNIRGTNGPDTIIGTQDNDRIAALAGDDTIDAEGGNDQVYAGAGNDRVLGGGGNDMLRGGPGADDLNGGAGDDVLRGRPGDDTINGGDGNDIVWVGSGADKEYGGDGNDRMHALAADNQVDYVDCGAGNDVAFENKDEHDVFVNCEKVVRMKVIHSSRPRIISGCRRTVGLERRCPSELYPLGI